MQSGQRTRPTHGAVVSGLRIALREMLESSKSRRHGGTLTLAVATTTSSELVSRIILEARSRYRTEGVTLSGGEPIHQIGSIVKMLTPLKDSVPALSIGLFSGYTERELNDGHFQSYEELTERERGAAGRDPRLARFRHSGAIQPASGILRNNTD